jgi:uncharacterized membrane protein
VVIGIGHEQLVEEAARADCELQLVPALGEFVPAGAPLFTVRGDPVGLDDDRLRDSLILAMEPTLDQDVSYGIRLLVDIAERSLSESPFQDPTTAVQAVDRLHDVLLQLVRRPFPDGRHHDTSGHLRLTVPSMSWDDYVLLATEEIRLVGAASPQVSRRLMAALTDVRSVAPADRVDVLDRQIAALTADVKAACDNGRDAEFALTGDHKGIGMAATAQKASRSNSR